MAHTSEIRWGDISGRVATRAYSVLEILVLGEALYQDLLEVWTYAGGGTPSDQAAANLLFKEEWEGRGDTQASAEEVAKVADMKDTMTSIHELYVALMGTGATAQEDRAVKLRRMS